MIYRVMTDGGVVGGEHRNIYRGDNVEDAVAAFMECLPPGDDHREVILEYDAHVITDEPAIVMRNAETGKTLAAMWGVTWEQFDKIAGID